jgi:polysaccharide pyruvyl transferase WcaK-like protein
MTERALRVCLILHSTRSDNLGVGALTVAEVAILRRIAHSLGREIVITILDSRENRAPYVSGVDIRLVDSGWRTILDPRAYFRIAWRSDAVIDIGAGDSFADIYGSGRLKRMFVMKFIAHLTGTPLVVAPQTIGPFSRPVSRALAKLSLRLSAIVASRDRLSSEAARDLGVAARLIEASDVALRLPADPPPPRPSGGAVRVGINVSGLLMAGGYASKADLGLSVSYADLIRRLIGHFLAHPDGCEVHLVAHVIVPDGNMQAEDDYRACTRLAEEFAGAVLAPAFASPSEAKSYIAGMDFFTGARMHACIAALSAGVPVVPMAYSRKFRGLFGSLGYDWTVDCTSETDEAIFGKITEAYESRTRLAEDGAGALALGLERLDAYDRALTRLLQAVPK